MNTFKARLNVAFAAMRKAGIVARQNFSCCGSCAGYEIATDITAMTPTRRAKVQGCAFYTKQEWSRFEGSRNPQGIHIPYGQVGTQAHGDVGLTTSAVGQIVATCLKEAGLEVEWDGTPEKTIYVKAA
jgi:hypothetical protein